MDNQAKDYKEFKLSSEVTVGQVEEWIEKFDRKSKQKLIDFVRSRFIERYILNVKSLKNSGFLKMSVACFMIETLQCFKMGEADSKNQSRCMFKCFFEEEKAFSMFKDISDEFYYNIRCGILHQSETSNAWRILCRGDILNLNEYTINADKFIRALERSLNNYLEKLERAHLIEDEVWKRLIIKLNSIIQNCIRSDEEIDVKKVKKKKKPCACKQPS